MSEYDMNYALTELKEQHPWLRNYHSKMLQMVGKQVAAARKTAKGGLSYRRNDDYNSFTYNQSGFRIDYEKNGKLWLSKIGSINLDSSTGGTPGSYACRNRTPVEEETGSPRFQARLVHS